MGYLKPKMNIERTAYRLENDYPNNSLQSSLDEQHPTAWVSSEYQFANFIYSTPEYQKPSPEYYRQGQLIAVRQMVLAGYRLSMMLNNTWIN